MNNISYIANLSDLIRKYRRPIIWSCLGISVFVSAILRISAIDHQLFWDEADNLLQMQELSKGWSVTATQLWHPPLYIFIGALLQSLLGFREYQMIILSDVLGLSTIVLTFLLARRLSGDRVAVFTAFAMAFSPHLNYFGSWIKQDVLMTFLVVAAMLAFVHSRWIIAGVLFALALLTKEPAAVFLVIIAIYSIYTRSIDKKKLGAMILIGLGLSIWWYLGFGGYIPRLIEMATGGSQEGKMWSAPFYEFFRRIPTDMTWTTTILFIAGIVAIPVRRNKNDILPVLWFALPYAILMFVVGKSNWFVMPFVPAIAWISAIGVDGLYECLKRRSQYIAICSLIFVLISWTYVAGTGQGYIGYVDRSNVNLSYIQLAYYMAESLEAIAEDDDRIAMPYKNPALLWLANVPRERIVDLPKDPSQIRQFIMTNKISKVVLWPDQPYVDEINKALMVMVQNNELLPPGYANYLTIYNTENLR